MNECVHPYHLTSSSDTTIWRYLDFTKFASLLDTETLFFCRSDRFEDPFEGATSALTSSKRMSRIEKLVANHPIENDKEAFRERLIINYKNRYHLRKRVAINCWHKNEFESEAMWKLYVPSKEGIAIKTNIGALTSAITKAQSAEHVHLADVRYVDYENYEFQDHASLDPFITKRVSFAHENEFRIFIVKDLSDMNLHIELHESPIEHGVNVKVDLNELIKDIYIFPTAPTWFKSLVVSICEKYSINCTINHSSLNKDPVF